MYQPEFTCRVEIAQTDVDTMREWRVVLGGAQRGGMAAKHGYLPTAGPIVEDQLCEILVEIRTLLEAYAIGLGGYQLELF